MLMQTTAHAYLRRFFLRRSIVEDDPREVLLAAVYLAAKVRARPSRELACLARPYAQYSYGELAMSVDRFHPIIYAYCPL